ncbi:16S rRNA (guanine(966)-N(2))-methyltransferase RsmD [Microbacterium sp. NPDC076911]|uniref:16S rRNA (guanine(966)-N(2))-methyltransferase RsmD n=1 Tax=Microbacterium sp. NPDC076911 TaxID=3154958 RepID=UPI003432C083
MTRIIAGRAGSLTLDVPDAGTRPTSDRVRESLFGSLESSDLLRAATVLDLYAGSGALALEALSRGARSAVLVEKAPKAAAVAQRNSERVLKSLGQQSTVIVHRQSADFYLRGVPGPFSLVFVDPPYDLPDDELSATLELLVPTLAGDACVIVERASRSPQPRWPSGLTATRDKRYGDTTMWWATTT